MVSKGKYALGDKLIKLSMKILGLSSMGNGEIYHNDVLLDWQDFEGISIEPIQYNDDTIDSVLIFGDATIKFHLKNERDTPIWSELDSNTIFQVIKQLTEKLAELKKQYYLCIIKLK